MAQGPGNTNFPLTISFSRDAFEKRFRNKGELEEWRIGEQQFWQQYTTPSDNFSQAINRNSQFLNILADADVNRMQGRLAEFSENYLPSQAAFSQMIDRLRAQNGNVARMALFIFLNPQTVQIQNNPEYIQALTIVGAYRALGDPNGSRQRIEEAVTSVQKLRNDEEDRNTKFNALYGKIDEDFKTKFEGYEAKMALSSPREYWNARAEEHKRLEAAARTKWAHWTAILVVAFTLMAVVTFTGIGEWLSGLIDTLLGIQTTRVDGAQTALVLAGFLKRALVLGGILGIGVWWLRQLLRELRSHEHLAEDAAERVTMIETYAALKAAGLGSEDFAPILTALYRAAATGLVTDDGGGPIFPWEALVKAAISKGREL